MAVVSMLLRAGASLAAADAVRRRSALHWLAHHGEAEMVEEALTGRHVSADVDDIDQ
jgi:hypothetical protein